MNFEFSMISDVIGLFSTLTVLFQLIKKFSVYVSQKRYIKTVLAFKHKTCYISQSIFTFTQSKINHKYVTLSSVKAFNKLSNILDLVGIKALPPSDSYEFNDIIHIGGPASNVNVNSIFVTKYKNIKFYTSSDEKVNHEQLELSTKFIEYNDKNKKGFEIGNKFLPLDKNINDYGIFIRIPFSKEIDYTTHIIFGGWSDGTLKSVEFFTKNYKTIAKKFGRSKYCFAIPISRINNSIELVEPKDIIDLTTEFFNL